jgi:hypothetical protein
MYLVDELVAEMTKQIPDMVVTVQRNSNGNAWIDLPKGHSIEVRQGYGFGMHTKDLQVIDGFGEHPNEVYHDVDSVVQRIQELTA